VVAATFAGAGPGAGVSDFASELRFVGFVELLSKNFLGHVW
jgi:hypothetical protein